MNPSSATGWWIVTYTLARFPPSERPTEAIATGLRKVQVAVRCEHWREAFWRARRKGLEETKSQHAEDSKEPWQFIGITDLVALPSDLEEGLCVGSYDMPATRKSREQLFEECVEDYQFEDAFEEDREGEFYRAIKNPGAGF